MRLFQIFISQKKSKLYNLSLFELIDFYVDLKELEETIKNADEKKQSKINWTNAWGKKYPVLVIYQKEVDIFKYAKGIRMMLDSLSSEYDYSKQDSMLV